MQTFLVGICYFGNIYMVPLYLQNVLGTSEIMSAALLLPLVLTQTFTTTLSGYVLKWTNRTKTSFCVGFVLWCAGQAGQVAFSRTTSVGVIVGVLLVQGLGIGATLQSSAALSYSHIRWLKDVLMRTFARSSRAHPGVGPLGGPCGRHRRSQVRPFSRLTPSPTLS